MHTQSKKIEILDVAETIIQKQGYNGFSYADISKAVNIRKASIHHHFPSKAALAVAVVRRYRDVFNNSLTKIKLKHDDWLDKLYQYGNLYEHALSENKLCLCGMLASDVETLPRLLKKEVQLFFTDHIAWLVDILSIHYKSLTNKRLTEIAWQIVSSLQGAVMLARAQGDKTIFVSASRELFSLLTKIK